MVGVFLLCRIIFISICIVTTIFGSVLIYTAFGSKSSLRNNSNVIFLSLVTADLITALTVMPLEIVHLRYHPDWPFGKQLCKIWNTNFVNFASLSVINLSIISLERLWALRRPFKYDSSMISSKAIVLITCLWLYAFLSGTYSYFIWTPRTELDGCMALSAPIEYGIPLLLINVLVPFIVCIITYVKIFRISQTHVRNITMFEENCRNNNWVNGKRKHVIKLLLTRKSTVTLGLLVGSFTVCYFPFFIFHIIDGTLIEGLANRHYIENIMKWLIFVSNSTDWALYGLLNRDFRQSIFRVLRKVTAKRNSVTVVRSVNAQ